MIVEEGHLSFQICVEVEKNGLLLGCGVTVHLWQTCFVSK
jgi:hypothetical protein